MPKRATKRATSRRSAGLLMYRGAGPTLALLLVHPGGPFWAGKDLGAWSIPKGEYAAGEDPLVVAQREFLEETGMRFVEWRQRLRLIHAIIALENGASVTAAGTGAGYASTSAFIAAFRAQTGETPAKFRRLKPR